MKIDATTLQNLKNWQQHYEKSTVVEAIPRFLLDYVMPQRQER